MMNFNFIEVLPKTRAVINQLVNDYKQYSKRPTFMCNKNLTLNDIMSEYSLADAVQAKAVRDCVEDGILDTMHKECLVR